VGEQVMLCATRECGLIEQQTQKNLLVTTKPFPRYSGLFCCQWRDVIVSSGQVSLFPISATQPGFSCR